MTGLARYVPAVALAWPGRAATGDQPLHRAVDGTLVFIDVSGFTALSERLAQRGKVGAEQLTEVLNAVFGSMLDLAAARGGSLLKFGGDALFLLYTGADHAAQAASSAVEMRASLARATKIPGPAGRLHLRMSVGVHTGPVDLFLVGASHRELVVAGPATTAVASMEAAASAGQILVSPDTAARLPSGAVGDALGPGRLLRWRTAHAPLPDPGALDVPSHDATLFVPTALRALLAAAEPESEHRTAGVAFLRYTGLDTLLARDPQDAADALGTLVTTAQVAADEQGVTFLATDLAEDGGKIILVAGFPVTAEDDQGRLLRAASDVVSTAERQSWPLAVQAGVNRGHVFAGAVGSARRATVTVMGDTVNLAARVMARADPATVLATPGVLDAAQTLFATEPVEPFMVKGKSRPVTAYQVGDETGTRPPRGLGALPFLGRDAELAAVCEAIDAVCHGQGGVVAITGDAGLGKSRLLAEALASGPDLTVLEARAEPYGAATPYRPVRDPVRSLLGLTQVDPAEMPAALTGQLEKLAPGLLPWAPLIGDVVGVPVAPTPETRDLDPQFRPERTAAAVVDLLEATVDGPLIIAFDDAHYSDDATAGLASRIERATASHPWLLLCALREGESGGYQPGEVRRVPLGPLDDEAARALVQHGTQAVPLRPHDVETVVTRAAGNPLFLEETLRNLREHGDLDALPSSLEGMVAAQIDALPPLSRRLVRRASVLGRSFRISVLTDLVEGEQVAVDAATRKELSDILEDDGPGRLRFRHALLRDAAYDSLPYQQRRELHLRAASSTLKRAGANPSSAADALALHYAAGGDWASTWHWARIAADQARRAYANPEAAVQCQRALDAARRLRDVTSDELMTTWQTLGDVRRLAGRLEEALDAYRHALRLAKSVDDQIRLLTLSARVLDRAGKQPAAHRDLTRAERLASTLAESDRDRALASVLSVRGTVLFEQERYAAAERQAWQAVTAARAVGDRDALANSLNNRGSALVMLGRGGAEAETSLREALAIYDKQGDLASQAEITMNLGGMAWFDGRWKDAADLYTAAVQSALRAGAVVPAALAQANLGELLIAQGHAQQAVTELSAALATLQAVGFTHAAFAESQLGRAHAVLGDLAEAERLRSHLMSVATPPVDVVDLAIAVADADVDAGEATSALDVLETTTAAVGDVGVYAAALARVRSRALAHLGRYDEAARSIEYGIEQCDVFGLGYERALLRLADQELRLTANEPVDDAEVSAAVDALRALDVTEDYIAALVGRAT